MKTFLKITISIAGIIILFIILLLAYFTITDYKPGATVNIYHTTVPDSVNRGDTLSIITWNIGYAGLDEEMDFFYDGGEKVRTTKEKTRENLGEIGKFLSSTGHFDFLLLQEVDKKAKRSWFIDETKYIAGLFKKSPMFFAFLIIISFQQKEGRSSLL